jgi:hypothetical protein
MQQNSESKNEDTVLERLKESQQKTEDRIDEGAKQLIALNGLLQGLFLAAFAFTDLRNLIQGWPIAIFSIALASLSISLICAALYFFPKLRRSRLQNNSPSEIRRALEQIYLQELSWRVYWLQRGQLCFILGLMFSITLMFIIVIKPSNIINENTIRIVLVTPTPDISLNTSTTISTTPISSPTNALAPTQNP